MDRELLYSVDRILDDVAVLEDTEGTVINVPLTDLPQGVMGGNMLRLVNGRYELDDVATESRRQRILDLQKRIRNK